MIRGRIYCVTCLPTGKLYFGQTVQSLEKRWKHHIGSSQRGSDHKFHRAIRKYGEENFLVEEVLTVSAPTKEILKKKLDYVEMRLIKRFNTKIDGYNSTDGGDGLVNLSEESLAKISKALKGRKFSDEWNGKISDSLTGRILSDEWKKKISESNCGKIRTLDSRKKLSESKLGNKNPSFGKPMPEELKEKLRRIHLGSKRSEETKLKMSLSMKKLWETRKQIV
jgi:group I intron endonuclease